MASTVPHPDERNPGRARHYAFAAAALLFVSLFTPWWALSHLSTDEPHFHRGHDINLFEDGSGVANDDATLATGLLIAIALAWVTWGLLAQSWKFEPGKWRRDILSAAVFATVALISLAWWPILGSVFGTFTIVGHDGVAEATDFTARPAIGAVLGLIAVLCLIVSAVASQKQLE